MTTRITFRHLPLSNQLEITAEATNGAITASSGVYNANLNETLPEQYRPPITAVGNLSQSSLGISFLIIVRADGTMTLRCLASVSMSAAAVNYSTTVIRLM